MTTTAPATTIASYASDFSKIGAGADWLTELRKNAWAEFEKIGFPTKRRGNELWKYTDLRRLNTEAFGVTDDASLLSTADLQKIAPWDDAWHTAVLVDGRYSVELSRNLSGNGISVSNLVESIKKRQAGDSIFLRSAG